MTKITQEPAKKRAERRAEAGARKTENPFLDTELHARMRDYTEREAAIAKELRAIAERGAGRRNQDPRYSLSLKPLLVIVKKGLTFEEMLARIALGTEKALWEAWLTVYGFELRDVNYAKTGPRNARLALDLGPGSKANALFAKTGVTNWRSQAAEDCAQLQLVPADAKTPAKSYAIFYLDPAPR